MPNPSPVGSFWKRIRSVASGHGAGCVQEGPDEPEAVQGHYSKRDGTPCGMLVINFSAGRLEERPRRSYSEQWSALMKRQTGRERYLPLQL